MKEGKTSGSPPAKLALFLPDLFGGGVAKVTIKLAEALADRGYSVDLVLCRAKGPYLRQIPSSIKVVELRHSLLFPAQLILCESRALPFLVVSALVRSRRRLITAPYLPALVRYLRRKRPDALLSAKVSSNLVAVWARRLAGVRTRIVTSDRTLLSSELKDRGWLNLIPTLRRTYAHADVLTTVSRGVADDLSQTLDIPSGKIVTIYNPVVNADLFNKAAAPFDHAWFQQGGGVPVVLGIGRLTRQKDFGTLLRAFASVRRSRAAKLVILGEGELRPQLEALARELRIAADVDMPGFVQNPEAYMARAAVFASSSAYEGLPNVHIEALAMGCPVVSTDCRSGPAEILEGGAYGQLVPVGDSKALAAAIIAVLDEPPPRDWLRRRAWDFSVERAADRYLEVLLG